MNKYSYNGPVMEFGICVQHIWKGETVAKSKQKAKSNLAFQWKTINNRAKNAKVTLPGEVELVI